MTTTPTVWKTPSFVHTSGSHVFSPQITKLSNGNYLVVSAYESSASDPSDYSDVRGTIYDARGMVVVSSFDLNFLADREDDERPIAAPAADGGFLLAYESEGSIGRRIVFELHDATGAFVNGGEVTGGHYFESFESVRLIAMPDGSFKAAYLVENGNGNFAYDLRVLSIAADGTLGSETTIYSGQGAPDNLQVFNPYEYELAVTASNQTVVSYVVTESSYDPGTEEYSLVGNTAYFRVIEANGTLGAATEIAPQEYFTGQPLVEVLGGGTVLAVWEDYTPPGPLGEPPRQFDIVAQRFTLGGVKIGSTVELVNEAEEVFLHDTISLRNGGFFIAYEIDRAGEENTVYGQRFDNLLAPVGSVVTLTTVAHDFPRSGIKRGERWPHPVHL